MTNQFVARSLDASSGRRQGQPIGFPAGLLLPLLLLLVWEAVARSGQVNTVLLPPPSLVAWRLAEGLSGGELWIDIGSSLLRLFNGFLVGSLIGIPLGLLLGTSGFARLLFGPSFNVFKQIAIFAWIPLISVWFGSGEAAKVAFVTLAVFTPVVINAWEGAAHVPEGLKEVAAVYRFSPWERLRQLIFPSALPEIFTGLRLGLIYGWLATVGAEYFMTVAPGIGSQMSAGRDLLDMELVMIGVFLLGLIGFLLSFLAERAQQYLTPWKRPS